LTSLARLRPEEDTRALKAAFEDYLHGTALDTHSIQSVCFVGENENQAGYLYETASRREIPVEIPATDSWLRSGLADLLLGDGTLVYIQDDAVEEVLARPYFERYPAQKKAVEEWLGYLSGRYCYVLPRERYGVILVLDSQVFDRLHHLPPDFGADPAFAAQSVGDRAFRDSQMVRNVCDRHVIAHCFPVSLLFIKPV
jgi:hypothetical protein